MPAQGLTKPAYAESFPALMAVGGDLGPSTRRPPRDEFARSRSNAKLADLLKRDWRSQALPEAVSEYSSHGDTACYETHVRNE